MERLADYPTDIWLVIVGVMALLSVREQTTRATQRAVRVGSVGAIGR
jgi:hypothetical protein